MTTAAVTPSTTGVVLGGRVWDLRFAHSALIVIHKNLGGGLERMADEAMKSLTAGAEASADTVALLVCAGEAWREPKLTLSKAKARLAAMSDMERNLLTTWAAGAFLNAALSLLEAKLTKLIPEPDED